MKRALYYAIHVRTLHPYIVAVTSEKRNGRNWYGRDMRFETSTNGTSDQLRGRFDTHEEAIAMRDKVAAVSEAYMGLRKRVSDYDSIVRKLECEAMDAVFKGEEPRPMPQVARVQKYWIASQNAEWHCDGDRGGSMGQALALAADRIASESGGVVYVLPDTTKERI